jgi:hypothetical protein
VRKLPNREFKAIPEIPELCFNSKNKPEVSEEEAYHSCLIFYGHAGASQNDWIPYININGIVDEEP